MTVLKRQEKEGGRRGGMVGCAPARRDISHSRSDYAPEWVFHIFNYSLFAVFT